MQLPSSFSKRSVPVLFLLLVLCLLCITGAKAQVFIKELQLCSGSGIVAAKNSICEGEAASLSLTRPLPAAASWQWMMSKTAGGPYENVTDEGASPGTYTSHPLAAGTYYYVLAIDMPATFHLSNEIKVTVNELPAVVAHSSGNIVCSGTPVVLSGSGAASYSWSAGVTNNTVFFPSEMDTYVLTGTDANGCKNTDMITVVVNQLPVMTASIKN